MTDRVCRQCGQALQVSTAVCGRCAAEVAAPSASAARTPGAFLAAANIQPVFARIAEASTFHHFVTAVIIAAGILVGLETYPAVAERHHHILHWLDQVVLAVFIAEIGIKMAAEGGRPWRYFLDSWNVFDFVIVAACFLPLEGQYLPVLRLFRLLRVLKLVSALPKLQVLVGALLGSVASIGYVSIMLTLLMYVYAVAGTLFFSANDPVHFGSLHQSMITMFELVTLEGWNNTFAIQFYGCDVMSLEGKLGQFCTQPAAQPLVALVFFPTFILLGTMVVLNLFVGVVVNSMEQVHGEYEKAGSKPEAHTALGSSQTVEGTLVELEAELAIMQDKLARARLVARLQGDSDAMVPGHGE